MALETKKSSDNPEVGGNFFELIEFCLVRKKTPDADPIIGTYGINVAKVREVVHLPKINSLASSVPGIAGIFELRGVPIPAINLCEVLGDASAPIEKGQQIIVAEFSQKRAGFIVSSTHRIRRVSWDRVLPPSSDTKTCMTGMILMENNDFLFILDLERILSNLEFASNGHRSPHSSGLGLYEGPMVSPPNPAIQKNAPVILAVDDSKMILGNLTRALNQEGYRVLTAHDGLEALGKVHEIVSGRNPRVKNLAAIVTDIEMPRLDGISLVMELRRIDALQSTPILLHTSLDGEASKQAALKAGANGYVVKNDILNVIETLKHELDQLESIKV